MTSAMHEHSHGVASTVGADGRRVVADLRAAIGVRNVVVDVDLLASYRHDAATLCESHLPLAAVLPESEAQVCEVMKVADRHGVPIIPQGALTGLSGGANCIPGAIALNTRRMNRVIDIDQVNRIAVVQPGVTNKELREAAQREGLTYRPDPSSWESSTIGGNIATNAGGLCCVKYGVTARFVRGLRVVLADGRVAVTGRRTVKGVAGLSLTELFVGSEGTLGVTTEATVALDAPSSAPLTMAATFPNAGAAGEAVSRIRRHGVNPSLLELMDRTTLAALNRYARMGFDESAGALLLAQTDSAASAVDDLTSIADLCSEAGAGDVIVAEDRIDSEYLIEARRRAYPALEALGPCLVDDVAVPISELAETFDHIDAVAARFALTIGVIAHAGDGNIHPVVVADPTSEESKARAHSAFDDIAEFALARGGTITGEHGVGLLKRSLLESELDPVAAEFQRRIKELFDPRYLLNPGKVLTARAVPEGSAPIAG